MSQYPAIDLIQGDCLELLAQLPADSVDLVLADPPYGTTQCKWDTVIPLEPLWAELNRVAKKTTPIVLHAAQPFTSALIMSNPKAFKYCWTWVKALATGHLNAKKQPMRNVEDVAVFYRSQCLYSPQYSEGEPYASTPGFVQSDNYGKYGGHREGSPTGRRYPKQVLKFPAPRGKVQCHPTQKPLALAEYLIRTYSNPGDLVLDFTMGSGTTGVAAVSLGRAFVGMELDPTYFQIAQDRIASGVPA